MPSHHAGFRGRVRKRAERRWRARVRPEQRMTPDSPSWLGSQPALRRPSSRECPRGGADRKLVLDDGEVPSFAAPQGRRPAAAFLL
jgi:hypothetical protein